MLTVGSLFAGIVGQNGHAYRTNKAGTMKAGINLADQCRIAHPDPTTAPDGPPSSPAGPGSRRRLNPVFVEWLMGFPFRWTDIDDHA